MNEFEFVIYDTPVVIVNGVTWYLAPFYYNEINMLSEWFKENVDYIRYDDWEKDGPYELIDDEHINGCDVLISSKVFTWLSLKYGEVNIDMFTDLVKYDADHYKFSIEDIIKTIQNVI